MHESLAAAIDDFRRHLQAELDSGGDYVRVSLGKPVEVDYDEVSANSPARQVDEGRIAEPSDAAEREKPC